jgi:hypothetical protein
VRRQAMCRSDVRVARPTQGQYQRRRTPDPAHQLSRFSGGKIGGGGTGGKTGGGGGNGGVGGGSTGGVAVGGGADFVDLGVRVGCRPAKMAARVTFLACSRSAGEGGGVLCETGGGGGGASATGRSASKLRSSNSSRKCRAIRTICSGVAGTSPRRILSKSWGRRPRSEASAFRCERYCLRGIWAKKPLNWKWSGPFLFSIVLFF